MERKSIKDLVINKYSYENNINIKEVEAADTVFVGAGAFKNCSSLESIFFGFDISRISHGAFENCKSLKDVWFAIIDEDKIVEIADDAFRDCNQNITFHIFATAIKNKYLNRYAHKHGFRVEGMIQNHKNIVQTLAQKLGKFEIPISCVINSSVERRKLAIEKIRNRWASKEEAYLFAKKAEKEGKLGMSYLACCDYLGWDVSLRREIMAKHKRKAHTHE